MNKEPQISPRPATEARPQPVPKTIPLLKPALIAVTLGGAVAFSATLLQPSEEALTQVEEQARLAAFHAAGPLPLVAVNLADPQERKEAWQSLNLSPEEAKRLQMNLKQQIERLVWLEVFDDCAEDGDIVALKTSSFGQEIPIFHVPHRVAVAVSAGDREIALTGIRDGVGGITVAVRTDGRIVPLPRLRPGQTVPIPIL